ncbi:TniQ family protein [Streptomyces sp. NPDC003860]
MTTTRRGRRAALTAADLPIRVPLVHGETTASYLARTAAGNGLPLPRLLRSLHGARAVGRLPLEIHPGMQEVYLDAEAVHLLGVLVERDPEQVRRALPGLCEGHPLPASPVRVTTWPDDYGVRPLRACPLCAEEDVWLVADGSRWRPCGCGRRWQCGDDGGFVLDTTPVPDIGRALQRHREINHRFGAAGDALVVDAHQVTLWWWVSKGADVGRDVWREREGALGAPRVRRRRLAPAVVYPEAVRLAGAMLEWEHRRAHGTAASSRHWLADVAALLGAPGLAEGHHTDPLEYWLEAHGLTQRPEGPTAAERHWNLLPALHHRPAERGPFRATSCLRWVYGLPLTSVTRVCPYCEGRAPSCRWVPAADCPANPSPASPRGATEG